MKPDEIKITVADGQNYCAWIGPAKGAENVAKQAVLCWDAVKRAQAKFQHSGRGAWMKNEAP